MSSKAKRLSETRKIYQNQLSLGRLIQRAERGQFEMAEAVESTSKRVPILALMAIGVIVGGATGAAIFISSSSSGASSNSTTIGAKSGALTVSDLLLAIPKDRPTCPTPLPMCPSEAMLTATVSVDASTPLSCLDVYLNGSEEGSTCWNLTSPAFTQSICNGERESGLLHQGS
jgi:hypothetical protein